MASTAQAALTVAESQSVIRDLQQRVDLSAQITTELRRQLDALHEVVDILARQAGATLAFIGEHPVAAPIVGVRTVEFIRDTLAKVQQCRPPAAPEQVH